MNPRLVDRKTESVFDITIGTSIVIFVKLPKTNRCRVFHADLGVTGKASITASHANWHRQRRLLGLNHRPQISSLFQLTSAAKTSTRPRRA